MSFTYYLCPYCYVRTSQSYLGREHRYCTQCGHTFDLDDTEAVTVGQSQPAPHNKVVASHSSPPSAAAVGPSTARSGGTS